MFDKEKKLRIGLGYDIHPFVEGRKLFLGGIEIPYEKGLLGHSDGDVLIHAIIDALLGASGLPDIGILFPNYKDEYKNIKSSILLSEVVYKLKEKKFDIENIDVMVIAEEPKISLYREKIISNLSSILSISKDTINIKATTNEGLGFVGRKEGIAVFAVALLSKENE